MSLKDELEKQGQWLFRRRSYLPLLVLPLVLAALKDADYLERIGGETTEELWHGFCLTISFLGLIVRGMTVGHAPRGTSGRNTKEQKAEMLNMTGMYSIMRHPLYFGNFLMILGIAMFLGVWWLPLFAILMFWLYYERIMIAEEEFLKSKFGDQYLNWANRTPAFLPNFKKWLKPDFPFSFKMALAREYTGFFVMTTAVALLDDLEDILIDNTIDWPWTILFAVGFMTYMLLRFLKKRTNFLYVEGR
ncbi:MAG: DUF1295 domain-containing protein [Nitrospirae bacterium]|nr:MAG: DUF1295 domain-containing protein [Nitrospirota bacterium]